MEDPEVAALRERLRTLEMRASPPTQAELLAGPSLETVARFLSVLPLAPWLGRALGVYKDWVTEAGDRLPEQATLLWTCLVQAHFRTSTSGSAASSSSTFPRP